jgi:UDP-2,4-diacetamido-2,4,6-trideoxy-beta-L-altropyranose hydrolase
MRCLALAQAWQDGGGKCIFAMANPLPVLEGRLRSEDIPVAVIEASPGSIADAEQLAELARKSDARWIVVDGYQFGVEYQRALKDAGQKVLAVDDYGRIGTYIADIVLDQNAGASEIFYTNKAPYTKLMLGTRYAMLRREFKAWQNWKREIPSVALRIVVTMGGSDLENLTEHVLRGLSVRQDEELEVIALVGGSSHIQRLRSVAKSFEGKLRLLETVANVPELMAWADIAIIAGGGTLWELLYMGCPIVSYARNAEQEAILSYLARLGCVQFVGNTEDLNRAKLASITLDLASSAARRRVMSGSGRETVDGLGTERICELIINGDGIGNRSEADACIAT